MTLDIDNLSKQSEEGFSNCLSCISPFLFQTVSWGFPHPLLFHCTETFPYLPSSVQLHDRFAQLSRSCMA